MDYNVTPDQIMSILGSKEVEIQILRSQLIEAQKRITELETENAERTKPS